MKLRRINQLEVNREISTLPDGVFGYSYAHSLKNISESKSKNFSELVLQKRQPNNSESRIFFEVKKYTLNDLKLVGYISDEGQLIYNKKELTDSEIIVFPYPYNDFKNKIEIPLSRNLIVINSRSIQTDDNFDISILEIRKVFQKPVVKDTEIKTVNKIWYEKWWGQIIIGLIVLILGTIILKKIHVN